MTLAKTLTKKHLKQQLKAEKFLLLLFSLILFSCSNEENSTNEQANLQSGVVISFDDDYIDEWVQVNNVLEPYNWKATFFITRFDQLSVSKIQELKDLKTYGHEIAAHGLNHINAATFIAANGTDAYLNQEIFPMINLMNDNDLKTTSFAYPYGSRNQTSDNILFNEFQILRGTTYGNSTPSSQTCYYNNNRLVFGLGLDNSYSHFSIPYFISLLQYAKSHNRIVIFYAHKPVETSQADYQTEYQTLIEICEYVKNNNMKFYKMSELYNLQNTYS